MSNTAQDIQEELDDYQYEDDFDDDYDDYDDDYNSEDEYDEYAPLPKPKIGGGAKVGTQPATAPKKKKKKPTLTAVEEEPTETTAKSPPKKIKEEDENVKMVKSREKGSMQDKTGKEKTGIPVKTQKSILDRIRWDEKLNEDDFTVGYLDRFLGIIESDLNTHDFMEIPLHRLFYFKYRGTVVWDRKTKVNMFKDGSIYTLIPQEQ